MQRAALLLDKHLDPCEEYNILSIPLLAWPDPETTQLAGEVIIQQQPGGWASLEAGPAWRLGQPDLAEIRWKEVARLLNHRFSTPPKLEYVAY